MADSIRPTHLRSRCVFRVAAGPRLGYGHLMRARALATCLDMDVVVSVRGGSAAKEAAKAVGPLVGDTEALGGADLLVVDDPSLKSGRSWIARARRAGIRSVAVHDASWTHDADLVVCGSLGISRPRTRGPLLCGPRFYLLDRRLADLPPRRPHSPKGPFRVVIALGGGQHVRQVAQRLVDAIVSQCPIAQIAVAAGFSRGQRPPLQHATWLSARTGLVHALLEADVAVVAGGVTLYEACAVGVPAVGLAVVPAQRQAIRAFARQGAVIDAGGGSAGRQALRAAAVGVARYCADGRLRTASSVRARALVDGRGAERVARHIQALFAGTAGRRG